MHLLEPVSRPAFTQFTSTGLSEHSSSRRFFPKLYSCGSLTMHPGGPRLRLLTRECGKRVGRRRDPPRITQEASCPPCFQEPRPGNGRLMRRSGHRGAGRVGRPIRVSQTRLDFKVSRLASTSGIRETGSGGEPLYTTMSATGRPASVGPTHLGRSDRRALARFGPMAIRRGGGRRVSRHAARVREHLRVRSAQHGLGSRRRARGAANLRPDKEAPGLTTMD